MIIHVSSQSETVKQIKMDQKKKKVIVTWRPKTRDTRNVVVKRSDSLPRITLS